MDNAIGKYVRYEWIDFGKGISMFLVILYHCEVYFPINNEMYSCLYSSFYLSFFFFLSGYLYTTNYIDFSFKKKMLQIFRGIIWTYAIFTSLICIPKSIVHGVTLSYGFKEILLGWASWFVVALGCAQIFFAIILSKIKKQYIIVICIFTSLIIGYLIKLIHPEKLPFQLDKAFLALFFLGIGFLYRLWEKKIEAYLQVKIKNLLLLIICYFVLYFYDVENLHTTQGIYWITSYNNFGLSIFYAILGILMMIQFAKLIPKSKLLCYVGRYSLIFYYLNGGVITILSYLFNKTKICIPASAGYIAIILIAIITSLIIGLIVKLIVKYCPIIIGDKKKFNTMAKMMHLNIQF